MGLGNDLTALWARLSSFSDCNHQVQTYLYHLDQSKVIELDLHSNSKEDLQIDELCKLMNGSVFYNLGYFLFI